MQAERVPNPGQEAPIRGPRGVTPPSQRRSRETLERILSATEGLLDGRAFSEISVLEICTTADVSASSFYARFDSKERLLALLHQRHLERQRAKLEATIPALMATDLDVRELLTRAATAYINAHVEDVPLIQTLRRSEVDDPSLADNRRSLDLLSVRAVADALLSRVPDANEWLRRRILFATRGACATLQESVQPPYIFGEDLRLDIETTVRETVAMWMAYVFLEQPD
ncbi:TetR/AcrR family transcriptional regulator [Aquihabitans daechungensis]|uniref:TetR/AcrR family transcriptional regulator n=1 Tax=Aquihabitans daechungensis TaxID=1052257 RepID=UPI003BA116A6